MTYRNGFKMSERKIKFNEILYLRHSCHQSSKGFSKVQIDTWTEP